MDDGIRMPFGKESFARSLDPNPTYNQAAPFLVSSKGRFIWSEDPFSFAFRDDELEITSKRSHVTLDEGHSDLQNAYKAAQKQYFTPQGKLPDPVLFTAPQYNTWIELMYDQREDKILSYAEEIVSQGFPPGVLMIDDNWQEDYGSWEFHPGRFSDPKAMVKRLHALGFKVMLWTCPFVSPDSAVARELASKDLLLKDEYGQFAIRQWWNGFSAVLDFTNEGAVTWYHEQNKRLMDDYGVDGFKLDGGDPTYYRDMDQAAIPAHASDHCRAYNLIGLDYPLNEYRAAWKCAGLPLAQRLADKAHSWGTNGLASLIPNGLAQGLMGYAFTCPDMIGGGEYQNFTAQSKNLDQELIVRYAQCSALFPMMQFSVAPWRVLDEQHLGYCLQAAKIHHDFGAEILELAQNAAITGEPIIRHMAYSFPKQGYEEIQDQFMLGNNLLVAPVLVKGARTKLVQFPPGTWFGDDGKAVKGPCQLEVDAPLGRLPRYRLL